MGKYHIDRQRFAGIPVWSDKYTCTVQELSKLKNRSMEWYNFMYNACIDWKTKNPGEKLTSGTLHPYTDDNGNRRMLSIGKWFQNHRNTNYTNREKLQNGTCDRDAKTLMKYYCMDKLCNLLNQYS
jgi:hypothetical protein